MQASISTVHDVMQSTKCHGGTAEQSTYTLFQSDSRICGMSCNANYGLDNIDHKKFIRKISDSALDHRSIVGDEVPNPHIGG